MPETLEILKLVAWLAGFAFAGVVLYRILRKLWAWLSLREE
jgi:hypothetical protein